MPWTKNTAVTALARPPHVWRTEGPRDSKSSLLHRAPDLDTSASQVCNSLFVGLAVGDQDVNHSDVADVPERHPTEFSKRQRLQ